MQSLYGIVFFIGVALLQGALRWPPDPSTAQLAPVEAVSWAALLTPFFATWAMPNARSLVVYPFAVIALWFVAAYAAPHFISPRPPDAPYVCGLGFLAMMIITPIGLVIGVLGRCLGLSVREQLNSAVLTYLVQLIPLGAAAALVMLTNG